MEVSGIGKSTAETVGHGIEAGHGDVRGERRQDRKHCFNTGTLTFAVSDHGDRPPGRGERKAQERGSSGEWPGCVRAADGL